jgi:hypothetical protein
MATDVSVELRCAESLEANSIAKEIKAAVKECGSVYRRIVITAGPWRTHDISAHRKGDTLELDFYSVGYPCYAPGWHDYLHDIITGAGELADEIAGEE